MLGGKPVIQRVYEQVAQALDETYVATDDERIRQAVEAFGGDVVMTSDTHRSGTDRCREACDKVGATADVVINIQGDEPFIRPEQIEQLKRCFDAPDVRIATLAKAFDPDGDFEQTLFNPNTPKVAFDVHGDALYFSRSPIPYPRSTPRVPVYEHIGIYGYRSGFLKRYAELPMTPLAETESLEQLKILEHGYRLRVAVTRCGGSGPSVDTAEDLEAVRRMLERTKNP